MLIEQYIFVCDIKKKKKNCLLVHQSYNKWHEIVENVTCPLVYKEGNCCNQFIDCFGEMNRQSIAILMRSSILILRLCLLLALINDFWFSAKIAIAKISDAWYYVEFVINFGI